MTQAVFEALTASQVNTSFNVQFNIEPEDAATILQDPALAMGVQSWDDTDAADIVTVADPLINTYAELAALDAFAFVDFIDLTAAGSLRLTYGELTGGGADKLTATGTLTLADSGANIAGNLAAILLDARVDALDATDNVVALTDVQFNDVDADGRLFAANDAIEVASAAGSQSFDFNGVGGGAITLAIDAVADGADVVSNFTLGSDIIRFTAALANGTSDNTTALATQYLSAATAITANVTIYNYTAALADTLEATVVTASIANGALGFATSEEDAGDKLLIVVHDGTDTAVYAYTYAATDDVLAADELDLLVTLTGVPNGLTTAGGADFLTV
jgi:hypothetical protein